MRNYAEILKEVEARFACAHPRKLLRNKPDKIGRPLVVKQCMYCGERVGKVVPAKTFSLGELKLMPLWERDLIAYHAGSKLATAWRLWVSEKHKELNLKDGEEPEDYDDGVPF